MALEMDNDVVIIGAGVAGLNAAITAARHGLQTLVVDKLGAGGQVINVDRIENFPGPAEGMAGFELGPALQIQADEAGAIFALDTIEQIEKIDGGFRVLGGDIDVTSATVIVAAGSSRKKLGVPGEDEFEGRGVSHCASCDGPLMKGRMVCVVGAGDSALDEALALSEHAEKVSIVMRHRRPTARQSLIEACKAAGNIEFVPCSEVERIDGDGSGVSSITLHEIPSGKVTELPCHGLFVYVGLDPNVDFVSGLVDLASDGRIAVDLSMQTSMPGLFAAGDIRSESVAHLAASAGDGVTAAISAVRHIQALKAAADIHI